jgi:antimicrobial peptide system SdpB family protein
MNKLITYLEYHNIFTSRIAFARTLLALNALVTLLFNDIDLITDMRLLEVTSTNAKNILLNTASLFGIAGPQPGRIIAVLILLFAISGYYPKISAILQAWVHVSLCNSLIIIEGGDQLASNLSLLLIPICLFDPRKNQWRETIDEPTAWQKNRNIFFNLYYLLIILQVSVVYLHAATGKLLKDDWLDGTCLYYWTTNNMFGAPLWMQEFYNMITLSSFTPIAAWSVILLELGLFASILATNRYIKRFFLISGLLFHFSILITHGLVAFFFAMFAALVLYLDSENEILRKIISIRKSKTH